MANVFRTDLVGGLVKPSALLQAEVSFASGSLDEKGLEAAQDAAIRQALNLQKDIGLPVITDGELRRVSADSPYSSALTGLRPRTATPNGLSGYCVAGRIQSQGRLTAVETRFLRANTGQDPFKVSLFAPSALALRMFEPGVTDAVYPTLPALAQALSEVIRAEVAALIGEGVPYIQLSCPAYAWLFDPAAWAALPLQGQKLDNAFEELLDVDVQMLQKLQWPGSIAVGLHIGRCAASDPRTDSFERMLENVLPRAPVDRFLIEYADPQPHDFTSLAALPADKIAALGLVSITQPEDTGDIIFRFDKAAKFTEDSRLAISTRCRFSNNANTNPDAALAAQRRALERTYDAVMQLFGVEM